jgi:hypothetical protein
MESTIDYIEEEREQTEDSNDQPSYMKEDALTG